VLLFLFSVIVVSFSEKKKKRIFACCGIVHYGSGTVQNRFFGGIRYQPFVF